MATRQVSDGELEEQLKWYREHSFTRWIQVQAHADWGHVADEYERLSWKRIRDQGFQGAGMRVAVVDHFAADGVSQSHGAAVEQLIREIAPEAEIHRLPLPEQSDGGTELEHLADAIRQAGNNQPDIINLSFSHIVPWDDIYEHRDKCPVALAATASAGEDALRIVVASGGNFGLGVLGCPSLGREVRRIGAVGTADADEASGQTRLDAGQVGTSFAAARISGFLAVLGSMYPGLSGRILLDVVGVINGSTHWPILPTAAELEPLLRFFRQSVSEDTVTSEEWSAWKGKSIADRHALNRMLSAKGLLPELEQRLDAHRQRAWLLVAAVETRRIGRIREMDGGPEIASYWYRDSVRLFERCGQTIEAARSRVFWAGSLMDIRRQWTVMLGPGGTIYLDPKFTQIESLLQGALKVARQEQEPSLESSALSSLCALYQQRNDQKELQQAVDFGEKALRILEEQADNEESIRTMINLASAHRGLAAHLKSLNANGWREMLDRAEHLVAFGLNKKHEKTIEFSATAQDLLAKIKALRK